MAVPLEIIEWAPSEPNNNVYDDGYDEDGIIYYPGYGWQDRSVVETLEGHIVCEKDDSIAIGTA